MKVLLLALIFFALCGISSDLEHINATLKTLAARQ